MQPPPIPTKDAEHLRIIAICHHVVAGLSLLGIGFLVLHYLMMKMFINPKIWESSKQQPPFSPDEFFDIMQWFYIIGGVFLVLGAVLLLISGLSISRRRRRTFSIIVAGLMCLQIPFGTVLGIFTLIILTRESVMRLYAEAEGGHAA